MPRADRFSEPAKITSSDFRLRSARPCSPSDHRRASARLLLPDPFGPTTALIPGPNSTTVRSANDLKPWSRRASSRAGALIDAARSSACPARGLAPEDLDRTLRGGGLGDASRWSLAGPEGPPVDDDLDLEQLLVIGAGRVDDVILRAGAGPPLGELLETALRALQGCDRRIHRDLPSGEIGEPAARRIEPQLEVQGAGKGLEGGGEDRRPAPATSLRLPLPEIEQLAQVDPVSEPRETDRRDDRGASGAQDPLIVRWMGGKERVGDRKIDDRVAEELEPLVVA